MINSTFAKKINDHYVSLRGRQTVKSALEALKKQEGQEWWFIVVELDDGEFLVGKFEDLRSRLDDEGDELLESALSSLDDRPLRRVVSIEQDDLTEELLSGTSLAVVTWYGGVVGVLDNERRRSGGSGIGSGSLLESAGLVEKQKPGGIFAPPSAPPAPAPSKEVTPEPSPVTGSDGFKGGAVADIELEGAGNEEPAQLGDINIDGDVHGNVTVAGGDIINNNYIQVINQTPPEKEVRQQPRVFESAFPAETKIGQDEILQVAVYVPGAPSPFKPKVEEKRLKSDAPVNIAFPVNSKTNELEPVDLEVTVTGTGFKVEGQDTKFLTVWPDGKPSIRKFQLEAEEKGNQIIRIEIMHEKRLLQELEVEVKVASDAVALEALNRLLTVVTAPLQFNFSPSPA